METSLNVHYTINLRMRPGHDVRFRETVKVYLQEVNESDAPIAVSFKSLQNTHTRYYRGEHFVLVGQSDSDERGPDWIEKIIKEDAMYLGSEVGCYIDVKNKSKDRIFDKTRYPLIEDHGIRKNALWKISELAQDLIIIGNAVYIRCAEPHLVITDDLDGMVSVSHRAVDPFNSSLGSVPTSFRETYRCFSLADINDVVAEFNPKYIPEFSVHLHESLKQDYNAASLLASLYELTKFLENTEQLRPWILRDAGLQSSPKQARECLDNLDMESDASMDQACNLMETLLCTIKNSRRLSMLSHGEIEESLEGAVNRWRNRDLVANLYVKPTAIRFS